MKFEDDTPEPGCTVLPYPKDPPVNLPADDHFLRRDDFYAFEGVDGSGKSTLVKAVAELTRKQRDTRIFKLSGSDIVRHALERAKWLNADPVTLSLLNWVSLFHQVTARLPPPGEALLFFDRYTLTIKTRGMSEGLDIDYMNLLEAKLPRPHKIFVVDCDPAICLARITASQRTITYFESGARLVPGTGAPMLEPDDSVRRETEGREVGLLQYLRRFRAAYVDLARNYDNVVFVDNSGFLDDSIALVLRHLDL